MFEPIINGPGVISPITDGPLDPYTGSELDVCTDVKFYYMYPKDPMLDTYKIATWEEACKIGEKEVSEISCPEYLCILANLVELANCRVWEDSSVKYLDNLCVKVYDLIHKDAYKVYFTILSSCSGSTQINLKYGILRVGELVVFDLSSSDSKSYVWGRLGARIPIYYDSISRFEDIEQEHTNTRTENGKNVPDYRTFFPKIQVYCVTKDGTKYPMKDGSYDEYTATNRDARETNTTCTQPIYRRWYQKANAKNEYYDHEGLGYVPTLTKICATGASISLSHFEVEISFRNEYASECVPTYTEFRLLYDAQVSGDLIKLSHLTLHIDKFRYTHTAKMTETVTVNGLSVLSTNTWWFFRAPNEETPKYVLANAFFKTTAKLIDLRVKKTLSSHSVTTEDTIYLLGSGIFKESENLKTVYIPKQVSYIPDSCFKECRQLSQVYCYGNNESEASANKLINILTSENNLNSDSTRLKSIGTEAFVDVGNTTNNILNASGVTILYPSALKKSQFIAVIAPNLTSSNDGLDGGMMLYCCSEMHRLRHFSKTGVLKLTGLRCYIDIPDNINTIHEGAFKDSTLCYDSLYAWKIPPSNTDDKKYIEKWTSVSYTGVDITIPYNVTKICSHAFDFGYTGRENSGQIWVDPNKVVDTPEYRKFSPTNDVEYWATYIEPNCQHHKLSYSGTCADYVKRISFEDYWIDRFWDFYCDNTLCSTVTVSDPVKNETVESFDIRQSRPTESEDDKTPTISLFDWPIPRKCLTDENNTYQFKLTHNSNTVGYIVKGSETICFTPCIHSYAFQNCASIKTLILDRNPSIIIGSWAFDACVNLKSIVSVNGGDLDTLLPGSFFQCIRLSPTQFNNLHVKSIHNNALDSIGGLNADGSIGLEGGEENAAIFNSVEYIGYHGINVFCGRHRCLDAVLKFKSSFVARDYSISMTPWNTYHQQFGHSGGGWIYLTLTEPKFRRLHPFTKANKFFDETMQNWFVRSYDKNINYSKLYNFYIFTESGDHLAGESNSGNTLQGSQTTWCVPFKLRYSYYKNWKFLDFLTVLSAYAKSYT